MSFTAWIDARLEKLADRITEHVVAEVVEHLGTQTDEIVDRVGKTADGIVDKIINSIRGLIPKFPFT